MNFGKHENRRTGGLSKWCPNTQGQSVGRVRIHEEAVSFLTQELSLNGCRSFPEISKDFFDKFSSINKVEAKDVVDRDHFEWFVKMVTELLYLYLTDTSLDQLTVLDKRKFKHFPQLRLYLEL